MPSKHTFRIKPIAELLSRYVGDGKGWIDPFAGFNSPAEITNDLNPDCPTTRHMLAEDFVKCLPDNGGYRGVLIDPPYSYRQVKEVYNGFGLKPTSLDTSANFRGRVLEAVYNKVVLGGIAISFGWNSAGVGVSRGYEILEILLVAHGSSHNDTIVTVEIKAREG